MDLWEDELLLDGDFSDEEEDTEEQIEEAALDLAEDGFTDWTDFSDGTPENERLEEALAEERALELESELEQDEPQRLCRRAGGRGGRSRAHQRKAAQTGNSGRGSAAAGGSRPDGIGFFDCGRRVEQAGQKSGTPGA